MTLVSLSLQGSRSEDMINNVNTLIMLHDIHKLRFFLFYSCRLLQGVETRTAAKDVMLGLPRVPTCCLSLLRLLVHTGTRAIAPPQGDGSTQLHCRTNLANTPRHSIHHIPFHSIQHIPYVLRYTSARLQSTSFHL